MYVHYLRLTTIVHIHIGFASIPRSNLNINEGFNSAVVEERETATACIIMKTSLKTGCM